jgi:hypothetical protein
VLAGNDTAEAYRHSIVLCERMTNHIEPIPLYLAIVVCECNDLARRFTQSNVACNTETDGIRADEPQRAVSQVWLKR